MNGKKRFSFVIPTYQNKKLIKNTLEALNHQKSYTEKDYEVIVVDDGSTDGTGDLIQGLEKTYEFKYIYLERNANSSRARTRNNGIQAASGDIIVFIDGDMLVKKNYLEELEQCFQLDENTVVIGNRIMLTEEVSYEELLNSSYSEHPKFMLNSFNKLEVRHMNYRKLSYNASCQLYPWLKVYSCNMAVSKKLLDKCGYFEENFKGWGLEDVELGYRLYKGGGKIVISNKIEAFHQPHEGKNKWEISRDKYKEVDKNAMYFIKKHPDALAYSTPTIVQLFRGNALPNLNAVKGIRKKVEINFRSKNELENVKSEIIRLSKQKSLNLIVNDFVEDTDLDIWIQLLGPQNSTPRYFPASKEQEINKVFGLITSIVVDAVFLKLSIKSRLWQLYSKVF